MLKYKNVICFSSNGVWRDNFPWIKIVNTMRVSVSNFDNCHAIFSALFRNICCQCKTSTGTKEIYHTSQDKYMESSWNIGKIIHVF